MQYFLCPRCQFRVPANKHICQTCGNKIVHAAPTGGAAEKGVDRKANINPFARLLGLNNQTKQTDNNQEEPALG